MRRGISSGREYREDRGGSVGSAKRVGTAEREQILRALRETNWVVGGADGAAARLGLKGVSGIQDGQVGDLSASRAEPFRIPSSGQMYSPVGLRSCRVRFANRLPLQHRRRHPGGHRADALATDSGPERAPMERALCDRLLGGLNTNKDPEQLLFTDLYFSLDQNWVKKIKPRLSDNWLIHNAEGLLERLAF